MVKQNEQTRKLKLIYEILLIGTKMTGTLGSLLQNFPIIIAFTQQLDIHLFMQQKDIMSTLGLPPQPLDNILGERRNMQNYS